MTNQVTIKEVAARDGLQAQSVEISLDQRREVDYVFSRRGRAGVGNRLLCIAQSGPSNGRDGRVGSNASSGEGTVQCARP